MARLKSKSQYGKGMEEWCAGIGRRFFGGEVVRFRKNPSQIGVIGAPAHYPHTYDCRVYQGPNPWDNAVMTVSFADVEVVEGMENPCKWTMSDRYPGPSSPAIKRQMANDEKNLRERILNETIEEAARRADLNEATLNEEFGKSREPEHEPDKIIPDEEDEIDLAVEAELVGDPVENKIQRNIEEGNE